MNIYRVEMFDKKANETFFLEIEAPSAFEAYDEAERLWPEDKVVSSKLI
jgi:hypothetical protein